MFFPTHTRTRPLSSSYKCVECFAAAQPKDWKIRMNKKERRLALATALQSAAGDMLVVDSVSPPDHKTKALVRPGPDTSVAWSIGSR